MSNYIESKKQLDEIRSEYFCKGDIIFTTAIQYTIEVGQKTINSEAWFDKIIDEIDNRHDDAEVNGKHLFMTREFEKALIECARRIAKINTHDLMVYIQREMYLNNGLMDGEPDYQRALQIIRNCLCYTADNYGAYPCESDITLNDFREMGLTDEEIEYFGWGYLLDLEEEE